MKDQVRLLDLELLDIPGEVVRDMIDPEKVRELAESIRSQGLLQPILVRPHNGRFEIVVGHRRYLAHRLIGEAKIKAIIKEVSDDDLIFIRAVENIQREDLNPIEKGKVFLRLKEKFNLSDAAVGKRMGVSPSTVEFHLDLLKVPEEFQRAVAEKRISARAMVTLNRIDDDDFKRYYMTAAVENGATVEICEMWLDDYRKTKAGKYFDEGGGNPSPTGVSGSVVVYHTCSCCLGPVESNKVKYIPVCGSCEKDLKGFKAPK